MEGGSSSVAERQLPKLNVAGSIPVSRSSKNQQFRVTDFNRTHILYALENPALFPDSLEWRILEEASQRS